MEPDLGSTRNPLTYSLKTDRFLTYISVFIKGTRNTWQTAVARGGELLLPGARWPRGREGGF